MTEKNILNAIKGLKSISCDSILEMNKFLEGSSLDRQNWVDFRIPESVIESMNYRNSNSYDIAFSQAITYDQFMKSMASINRTKWEEEVKASLRGSSVSMNLERRVSAIKNQSSENLIFV